MKEPEEILTASEGADRVAARRRFMHAVRNQARTEEPLGGLEPEEVPTYTCENCGGHEFQVIHSFAVVQDHARTLLCSCKRGDPNPDEAANQELSVTTLYTRTGVLDDAHRVTRWGQTSSEVSDRKFHDPDVHCQRCFDRSDETDWGEWDEPEGESEEVEEEEEWEVRCADCDHEIEFGWSHPDRGGRIWPCESSDHNPWKSFPEERFHESWQKRGWLRPAH